jgi:hypothetical protein
MSVYSLENEKLLPAMIWRACSNEEPHGTPKTLSSFASAPAAAREYANPCSCFVAAGLSSARTPVAHKEMIIRHATIFFVIALLLPVTNDQSIISNGVAR